MEMMSEIKTFFLDECGLEEDVSVSEPLFSSGMVDSLNLVKLLDFIEQKFEIQISPLEVGFENFDTIEKMTQLVSTRITQSNATH